jgi:hypothetical protein
MTNRYAAIHVRKRKGQLEVVGMGQTARRQTYPKATEILAAKDPSDPKFKEELQAAVDKLLA